MGEAFLAVSALVPSGLLVWYFHTRDYYPEPPRVLWTTFALGILTIVPVGLVQIPVAELFSDFTSPYKQGLLNAFVIAAIPEECAKLCVLMLYSLRTQAFDEPMDGIVYGVVASMGFATMENILYVLDGGIATALVRAFTAVPVHAFLGAVMGYYLGRARFEPSRRMRLILFAYVSAVLLHGWYDFPLLTLDAAGDHALAGALIGLSLLGLVVGGVWAMRVTQRVRRAQLDMGAAGYHAHAALAHPVNTARWIHIVQTVVGVLVASVGGILTFGISLAFLLQVVLPEERLLLLWGGFMVGVAPLATGILLFFLGVRGLNRLSARHVVPVSPAISTPGSDIPDA
jgi:protease PrsW